MVSNLDNAIEFYSEKLGLKLKDRYGDHYAEIETPGVMIGLHPADEHVRKGNNISIGFGVDDLDRSIEDLKKIGIEIKDESDGGTRLAHFTDPDDNPLYLIENRN